MNGSYEVDVIPGPGARGYYRNFTPLIADFLTDDVERIAERKAEISEEEWRRTEMLGQTYLAENYARPRDGRPCWAHQTADQINEENAVFEPSKPRISLLEVPKRILFLILSLLFTLLGAKEIRVNPRIGWLGVLLFGSVAVASLVSIFRLPRDLKKRVDVREVLIFKSAYMWIGTFTATLLIALAGVKILGTMNGIGPKFAIWFSAFITMAALYPFTPKAKRYNANFILWAIVSAFFGLLSLVVAVFVDWVEVGHL